MNSAISLVFKSRDFGGKTLFGELEEIDGVGGLYGGDDSYDSSSNAILLVIVVIAVSIGPLLTNTADIKDIKSVDFETLSFD